MERKVSARMAAEVLLTEVGVPCHLKGFDYCAFAIARVIDDPTLTNYGRVAKELYPMIAVGFRTSAKAVERSIRHAVDFTFSNSDLEVLARMFGNSISMNKGKATNSQFISTLAKELRRRMEEG